MALMKTQCLVFSIGLLLFGNANGLCTFPPELIGAWLGAERGNVTFENSTYMASFQTIAGTVLPDTLDFYCLNNNGDLYFLKSTYKFEFGHVAIDVYVCMQIKIVDDFTAFYYHLTEYDPYIKESLAGDGSGNITMEKACSKNVSPRSFISLVKLTDAITSTNRMCPSVVEYMFNNVTVRHHGEINHQNCEGTSLEGCNSTLSISYGPHCTAPEARTLSDTGQYNCLFSIQDGDEIYISMWKTDIQAENPFSCWAVQNVDDTVYATETPGSCTDNTSSTTTQPGEVKIVLTDITGECRVTYSISETTETTSSTGTAQDADNFDPSVAWLGYTSLIAVPVILIILSAIFFKYRAIRKSKSKQEDFDVFGSASTIHVDVVGKATFNPQLIKIRKKYNFRPKRLAPLEVPILERWSTTMLPNLQPAEKVTPLYNDLFDD